MDERLAVLQRRLDSLPVELGERESQQAALAAAAEALEMKRKGALTRSRDLENDVKQKEARVLKLEEQIRRLHDAGAIQVAEHEAQELRDVISKAQDEALERLETAERLGQERDQARAKAQEAARELELFRRTVAEDLAQLGAELGELRRQRDVQLDKIPPAVREIYEKLLPARKGRPVAPLKSESCGGCGMVLPPNDRMRVAAASSLVRCRSCSRILVPAVLWSGEEVASESEAE